MISIQVCTLLQTNEAFRSSFFMLFVLHHRCLITHSDKALKVRIKRQSGVNISIME